jgi:hypothetical protein
LNPCVAHCSTDSIPWVHHSREEGSLDYDGGFVRLQIHMKFDTNIHRQQLGVGRRDPNPEKGPLHPVADRPAGLGGDLSDVALHLL